MYIYVYDTHTHTHTHTCTHSLSLTMHICPFFEGDGDLRSEIAAKLITLMQAEHDASACAKKHDIMKCGSGCVGRLSDLVNCSLCQT